MALKEGSSVKVVFQQAESLDISVRGFDLLTVHLCGQTFDGRFPKESEEGQRKEILFHFTDLSWKVPGQRSFPLLRVLIKILVSKYLPGQFQILPAPG